MNSFLQAQKLAQRRNEEEAVWQAYEHRRALRKLPGACLPLAEEVLDALDWQAAEQECQASDGQGRFA